MTVEVSRDALLGALRSVVDMVEKRTTIPVLSNLLFVAEGGRVSVTATDLDRHAIARCEAAGELCTTMPADKLLAAVSSLKPGVKLTIEPIAGRAAVTIKGGGGKRTIPTLPAKDFPERELPQDATRFSVSAAQFVRMLDAVGIAQSAEETRYYLIGVYLHAADKLLRAAATDGQRLMRAEIPLPEGAEAMPAVIIPTKAVTALRKLLGKAEGDAVLSVTRDLIAVQFGEATILSRTVEGSYPDYSRVIPSDGLRGEDAAEADEAGDAPASEQLEELGDALSVALILAGALDWKDVCRMADGEDTSAGEPLPFSRENLEHALSDPLIFDAFDRAYVMPFVMRERTKNVSAASQNGTGEAATQGNGTANSPAKPKTATGARRARTGSKSPTPRKRKASGRS